MGEKTRHALLEIIENFKNKNVLVIGDSILDEYIYGRVVGLSSETPTIKLEHEKTINSYGGAANVVKNLLALGANVSFITLLGNDDSAAFFQSWKHQNLKLIPVIEKGRKTIVKRKIWGDGYNHLEIEHLDNHDLSSESEKKVLELAEKEARGKDIIMIQDARHGMMTPSLINKIKNLTREHNKKIIANSQITQRESNHLDYRGVDLICMNMKEAKMIEPNLSLQNVSSLKEKLNAGICITDGTNGALLQISNDVIKGGGVKVKNVVDTCGAGDSFISALALADPFSHPEDALYVANCWAALSIQQPGTQTPPLADLRSMVE